MFRTLSTLLPTGLRIQMHVQHTVSHRDCIYSRLPEDEPSASKHVEDINKLKY